MSTWGSIGAALAAACSFAVAAVLQQEAARRMPREYSGRITLLARLLRQPAWLAGVAAMLLGYSLQAVALALGPVALVQPIIATELAFAIPVGMARVHRSPGVREWVGIASVLAGVSFFLLAASPAAGSANPSVAVWVDALAPTTVIVLAILVAARRSDGPARPVLLASAAGLCFGVVAVLTKSTIYYFGEGASVALTRWEPYGLVAVGVIALVCSQSAYQSGPLAYSMPMVAVLEPASAVVIGATALEEALHVSQASLAVSMSGALLAVVGIVLLARSPLVHGMFVGQELEARVADGDDPRGTGGARG